MYVLKEEHQELWLKGEYSSFISNLEYITQTGSKELLNYWYLGLAYLLQREEETAQLIWLSAIAENESDEDSENILASLVEVLTIESQRFTKLEQYHEAWTIRHYIRELKPQDLNNLLHLIDLDIKLERFNELTLKNFEVVKLLNSNIAIVQEDLVIYVFSKVIQYPFSETLIFAEVCLPYFKQKEEWTKKINDVAEIHANELRIYFAIQLVNLCLKYFPDNITALGYLPQFYTDCKAYKEAIDSAKDFCKRSQTSDQIILSNCILFRTLLRQGDWIEIPDVANNVKLIIDNLIQESSTQLSQNLIRYLVSVSSFFLYIQDNIAENRKIQNQVSNLFIKNIETNSTKKTGQPSKTLVAAKKNLKIGYIASTLRNHSVGWLSRWLFQYHDRKNFEVCIYLVKQKPDNNFFANWFADQVDHVRILSSNVTESVKTIRDDELDILIDLDSVTLDYTCTIMAFKPAPIQATWLGYDASGLPTIDYFIADPYVLPDDAQAHYQEKIWRLPKTYIAVTGFEVDVPTIHRSDLDIPEDAVIYWSSQAGLKRNPHIVRLQMKILQKVPNSYFLLKGSGDQTVLEDFFTTIAKEEGVSTERLRFLPIADNEYIHRANLQIADVVLDTYPYNGATTTLETLWAGVPLVTRVGQQFSARNSYAFMMNVGVTEGISWTDEEYIEWGVRFGQNETLRQQVSWKLKKSRHTSPLWNPKQFTLDMETAYRQMYSKFVESQVNH